MTAIATGCNEPDWPSSSDDPTGDAAELESDTRGPSPDDVEPRPGDDDESEPATVDPIVVRRDRTIGSFSRELLGTNIPAWLGPERLTDPEFIAAIAASGVATLRMPGGSWANYYDWHACQLRDPEGCYWLDAARPSDFAELMAVTGLPGIWTINVNETAQQAAAAVAFFNGALDDDRTIGIDRNGFDWGKVSDWAGVRSAGGHRDPVPVRFWEIGNEVYGGTPDAGGDSCASIGWEDVWTCDGTEYALGNDGHDGFIAIRAAMEDVDPDIEVGAVGVTTPESWGNWGNEVVEQIDDLDLYVVHHYGFDSDPMFDELTWSPSIEWPSTFDDLEAVRKSVGRIAVTEHNIVSTWRGDDHGAMTSSAAALYLAETIGQLALGGVTMANHWNFANGVMENGTDYGVIDADDFTPYPTFFATALWGAFGDTLVETVVPDSIGGRLGVYASTDGSRRTIVVIVNRSGDTIDTSVELAPADGATAATLDRLVVPELSSHEILFNGRRASVVADLERAGTFVEMSGTHLPIAIEPWSMNVIEFDADG